LRSGSTVRRRPSTSRANPATAFDPLLAACGPEKVSRIRGAFTDLYRFLANLGRPGCFLPEIGRERRWCRRDVDDGTGAAGESGLR
jgi:hypothetical protein